MLFLLKWVCSSRKLNHRFRSLSDEYYQFGKIEDLKSQRSECISVCISFPSVRTRYTFMYYQSIRPCLIRFDVAFYVAWYELRVQDLWRMDRKLNFNGLPKIFNIYIHVPLIVRTVISLQSLFSGLFQWFILSQFWLELVSCTNGFSLTNAQDLLECHLKLQMKLVTRVKNHRTGSL